MRGWLIDIYPDYETNSIIYWVKTRRGVQRATDHSFLPRIYVHSAPDRLDELEKATTTRFAPRRLPELVRELLLNGPPVEPLDVGL